MMQGERHLRIGLASALAVLCLAVLRIVPSADAAQSHQGLQDGCAVRDHGQITGGLLLSDELGYMQQGGAGWVRVNFRLGQCLTNWTSIECNGLTAAANLR